MKIRQMIEAATQGPWEASRTDMDRYTANPEVIDGAAHHVAYLYREPEQRAAFFGEKNREDLALIVALKNNAPALAYLVEAARKTCIQRGFHDEHPLREALSKLSEEFQP